MYKAFYGLKEDPFSLNTDPRFYYYNEDSRNAIKQISYDLQNGKGLVEIVGDIGTGKTVFCHALINYLSPNTRTVFLPNAYFSELEFLEIIAQRLEINCSGKIQSEIIQAIGSYLVGEYAAGRNVVLIFDEAQNLSNNLLEQIRLLSNIGIENNHPLQIVLAGQLELEAKLRHPVLRNLDQRICCRYYVKPLKRKKLKDYIFHRLKIAGYASGITFTSGALNSIYNFSKGLPRLINVVCDKSLLVGYFFKTRTISTKTVKLAIKNTQGRWYHFPSLFLYNLSKATAKVAIIIMVFSLILTWQYQHKIIGWSKKVSPSLSLIKAVVLNQFPPLSRSRDSKAQKQPELSAKDDNRLIYSTELMANPHIICAAILIKMWGIEQPVNGDWKTWKRSETEFLDINQIAGKYGLQATQLKTDLAELQAIDLPCILQQVRDNESSTAGPMVLAKLTEDKAILYNPRQGLVNLSREDLARNWSGQAVILWRNLDQLSDRPLFSKGSDGEDMQQVRIRLRQLGYLEKKLAQADGQALKEAIRKFQQDNQLMQDGILGAASKIALYRILSSPFGPSLSGEG